MRQNILTGFLEVSPEKAARQKYECCSVLLEQILENPTGYLEVLLKIKYDIYRMSFLERYIEKG
jgi:hypothetical protein